MCIRDRHNSLSSARRASLCDRICLSCLLYTSVAALQAGAKPFAYEAQDPIEVTHDVVIVGAGGAGIAAAAQAAQNGDTVLVIETNA